MLEFLENRRMSPKNTTKQKNPVFCWLATSSSLQSLIYAFGWLKSHHSTEALQYSCSLLGSLTLNSHNGTSFQHPPLSRQPEWLSSVRFRGLGNDLRAQWVLFGGFVCKQWEKVAGGKGATRRTGKGCSYWTESQEEIHKLPLPDSLGEMLVEIVC